MSRIERWQSGTAAFVALGIMASAVAPFIAPASASAQTFGQEWRQPTQVTIPSGISIPVTYDKADKIVVAPNETVPLALTVSANVKNRSGDILIPYGTQVVGQVQPVDGGSQFVAQEIVFRNNNKRQSLDASSQVISKTQEVRPGADTASILKGAAVGSAAAALISGVAGNKKITALKVLSGTAAGAVGGLLLGHKKADVVVINSNSDLALKLRSDLVLANTK